MKVRFKTGIILLALFIALFNGNDVLAKGKRVYSEEKQVKLSKGEQINKRLEGLTKVCENIKNSYECAQAIEKQEIKKYPDLVKRDGDKLILKMDDGSEVVYEDGKSVKYFMYNFIPENNVIIVKKSINYYSPVYDMIHKAEGDKIQTSKINFPIFYPVFASNGNEFILYVVNEMEPNTGIEIWKIKSNKFINEFKDDEFRYFKNVKWVNDNQITVNFDFINEDKKRLDSDSLKLEKKDNKWIIIENKINK